MKALQLGTDTEEVGGGQGGRIKGLGLGGLGRAEQDSLSPECIFPKRSNPGVTKGKGTVRL